MRHAVGHTDHALRHLDQALTRFREAGYGGEVYALRLLATIHCDLGRYTEALDRARTPCDLAREIRRRTVEADAWGVQAAIEHHLGRHGPALDHVQRALRLIRDTGQRYSDARLLIQLACVCEHSGRYETAQQAVQFTREHGYRMLEGVALTVLAGCRLEQGDRDEGKRLAEEAVAIPRETGYRLGEARALLLLGHTALDLACYWTAALDVFTRLGTPEAGQIQQLLTHDASHTSRSGSGRRLVQRAQHASSGNAWRIAGQ